MRECMIKIEHLQKAYPEAIPLKDVNAEIYKGDVIAVIGPSGTGKSTLLRCINRLEEPTSGTINVLGIDVTGKNADISAVRQRTGMVFQSFYLFDHLTLLENIIAAPMDLKKLPREEAVRKAKILLDRIGLRGKEEAFPSELSGGQKQRAAIARALAMDPEVLLLDEPTSALDPKMVHAVQHVIHQLADTGITMMIVTHEMEFARSVSNRVFFMCDGIVYEEGPTEEIFEHPKHPKTLEFMLRKSSLELELTLDPEPFDVDDVMLKIQNLLRSKNTATRNILRTQAVFEEIAIVTLRAKHPELKTMKLAITAGKEIELAFTYGGENINPLEDMDEISRKLLMSFANYRHDYQDGTNTVSAVIRQ